MSRDSLICIFLIILIPTIISGQEFPTQNESKEQRINYRTTDQKPNTHDQSINNFFPLNKVTAGNEVWTELHPLIPRVGYWGVDFVNADTGWAVGEAGAIIKTTNGGQNWEWIESGVEPVLFTVNTYNGQTIIAAGQDGMILLSTDEGENWQTIPSGTSNDLWNIQMITENLGWMVGVGGSALKTTDGGFTWLQQPMPFPTLSYWDVYFLDENFGYISSGSGIVIKTTNGGVDWEVQQAGDNRSLFTIFAIDSQRVVSGGFAGKVVYTSDGGSNWQQLCNLSASVNKIKFVDELNGFAVTNASTHQTTDGGLSWFYRNDIINGSGENNIVFLADTIGYLIGGDMFLIKTTDAGVSWNKTIMTDDYNDVFFISEQAGFTIGNNLYKTTDAGITWNVVESFPIDSVYGLADIVFTDSLIGYVGSYPNTILKTTDGGESWFFTNITGLINTTSGIRKIFFFNSDIGWAGTTSGGIIKTIDGGNNWEAKLNDTGVIFNSIFFIDSIVGWTANINARPFKTTDGGENWIEQTNITLFDNYDIYFIDSLKGISTESNELYKTTDGGNNWNLDSSAIDFGHGRIGYFDSNNIFITGTKVYRTTDGGYDWTEFPELEGLDWRLTITLPSINLGYLVGTIGLIIKYFDDSVTYISPAEEFVKPDDFYLFQNYPNPFNSSTLITYQIPQTVLVTLKIYDVLGNEVTTLIRERKSAGSYTIEFQAENLSTGIYLYKLTADNHSLTRKLILLK